MTSEARAEIPSGYTWKHCLEINAQFPMPETWFFQAVPLDETKAYFLTKQSLPKNGMFTTGLCVNSFSGIKKRIGKSALEMAEGLMQTYPLVPLSRVTRLEDGPLIRLRRFFLLPIPMRAQIPQFGREAEEKVMPPTNFYIETTANRDTDTAYIIQFETPLERWKEDKEIAIMMVENGMLDKTV